MATVLKPRKSHAAAPAHRRMNTLGVAATLVGNEPNPYFLEVFNGIVRGAAAAGQATTVFPLGSWDDARERIPAFCDGRIDGLVMLAPLLPPDAADWLPERTPVVSVHANHAIPGVVNLESDEEAGAFEMVSRLIQRGHRRILHVAGPEGALGAERRVQGYRRAHAAAGFLPPPDHVLRAGFGAEDCRRALEAWLRRHCGDEWPEVIFAVSDAAALGCIEALLARGLRMPADVSVIGFDDSMLARAARLATVRQPLRDLGRRAVEVLVERIDARSRAASPRRPKNIVLPTELVPGATLAAPRAHSLTIA